MDIHHFGHGHKLVFKDIKNWQIAHCRACGFQISGSAYYDCTECYKFNIHKSCAELPREVISHFHPQHTLTLLSEPPYKEGEFKCFACEKMSRGFTFHCSECKYDLDVQCAGLIPIKGIKGKKIDQNLISNSHPHPLVVYDKKKGFDILCSCCVIPIINGLIYVCLECKVMLDESCTHLPQKIQHLFHPEHPLTLLLSRATPNQHRCNACGKYASGFLYRCSECDFDLDIRCASLIPTTNNYKNDEEQFSHRHPLIHCGKTKNLLLPFSCSGCFLPFQEEDDSVYVCLDCEMLLHKSCANLPHEMEHPFHLTHTLSLFEINTLSFQQRWAHCSACMYIIDGLIYWCRVCRVFFHLRCLFPLPLLIYLELHKHPLVFFNSKKYFLGRNCNICKMECCIPVLRCLPCNFSVHLQCLSELPPTVKHKCHLHSLTLTRSPIKDHEDEDNDAEFYCDACEEYRKLSDTTYYCAECHYVAHVHCVISEVWPHLQRVSLALGDKLGKLKLDIARDDVKLEIDVAKEEVGVLVETSVGNGIADCDQVTTRANDFAQEATKELRNIAGDDALDELDEEIALVHTRVDALKALKREITRQLETETMKLDQLKKRRDQHILFYNSELKL